MDGPSLSHSHWKQGRLAPAVVGVLVALCVAPPALGDDLRGRAVFSWRRLNDQFRNSDGSSQDYDLWFRRPVSETLSYRLFFGAQLADSTLEADGSSVTSESRQFQSRGELLFTLPKFQVDTSYEGFDTSYDNGISGDRGLERGTARLNWQPDHFPDLALWVDRRTVTDDLRDDETRNLIVQTTLSQDLGPWRLAGTVGSTKFEDEFGEVRSTDDLHGNVRYQDFFYDGRLTTSAKLFLTDSTRSERRGRVGTVTGPRLSIENLTTGIDPTPVDARDVTLMLEPVLIDGQFVPTGVDLGPTGQSFLNVALDMGRLVPVRRVFLYVRDSSGNLVPSGGPLDWSVYVSDDELDWVRLTIGARSLFDPARSLYEVTFPPVTTRYIKVVSFGLNLIETELVEVEAFEPGSTFSGEDFETGHKVGRLEGTIAAEPAEWVNLSWTGRWNTSRTMPQGESELRTDDSYHYLSADFQPAEWTDLIFRYERRDEKRPAGSWRNFDQLTADLVFRPRPGVNLTVEALTSWDDGRNRETNTAGLAVKSQVKLWRSLDLRLDMGERWSDQRLPSRQEVTRRFANFWTIAQLHEDVQLTTQLTATRDETVAPGSGDPVRDDYRWWMEAFWSPGPPLVLSARMGSAGGENGMSADIRRYQIQWNPFRGGRLHIGMIYDEDVDITADRTFRRLLVSPGWRINHYAWLNMSYTRFELSGARTERSDSGLFTLTLLR